MQTRKVVAVVAVVAAVCLLVAGTGYGQSAKSMAMVSSATLINATPDTGGWQTVLVSNIKTANQKNLFIDAALECGIYTRTLARSKGGNKDTSTAAAVIQVRVLVDNVPARPGNVVYAMRYQQLSATLEGMIASCLTVDPLTGSIILDPDCVTPEEIELIQETMSANSFNFVADVTSGDHILKIQARIQSEADAGAGEAEAWGMVGWGGVTVEEVRLVKGLDWYFD